MQLMSYTLGGKVASASTREYGETDVNIDNTSPPISKDLESTNVFLMSHTDYVEIMLPEGFKKNRIIQTSCPNAAIENRDKKIVWNSIPSRSKQFSKWNSGYKKLSYTMYAIVLEIGLCHHLWKIP